MKAVNVLLFVFTFATFLTVASPQVSSAADLPPGCVTSKATADGGTASFKESTRKCGINEAGGTGATGLNSTMKNIINLLIYVAGTIAVFLVVIGGFRFVTADGDSNTINKARMTITYAAMGLAVTIMAYSIVNFVLGRL